MSIQSSRAVTPARTRVFYCRGRWPVRRMDTGWGAGLGPPRAIGSQADIRRNARGRMTNITADSVNQYGIKPRAATSGINALGQRLTKAGTVYTGTLRFVYGEDGGLASGHKLIGEYDNAGALITEHVYLQDTPIAVIKTAGAYLIQADHLNTPRAVGRIRRSCNPPYVMQWMAITPASIASVARME